jgi:hypothetical protein
MPVNREKKAFSAVGPQYTIKTETPYLQNSNFLLKKSVIKNQKNFTNL